MCPVAARKSSMSAAARRSTSSAATEARESQNDRAVLRGGLFVLTILRIAVAIPLSNTERRRSQEEIRLREKTMSFYRGMTCENVTIKGDKGTPITAYTAKPEGKGP